MAIEDIILSVINFIEYPTWHLVVLYVILFAFIAWKMVKSWGF
jgi:hypothetical protein